MTATAKAPAPARPSAPPPPAPKAAATPTSGSKPSLKITSGIRRKAHRVVVYGTGGIGKSSLAASLNDLGVRPVFLDVNSGTDDLDVARIDGLTDWSALRDALHSNILDQFGAVVIDRGNDAERMAADHVIATVPTSNGTKVTSLETYGYGKGYQFLYEEYMRFLADCDRLYEAGKHVIIICDDCKATVPNPMGEDYIRFEPLLYSSNGGKASIRERVKGWADHVLFIGYDVAVSKDGKGQGAGTRAIYCQEHPTFIAKSRTLVGPYVYQRGDVQIWKDLFNMEDDR